MDDIKKEVMVYISCFRADGKEISKRMLNIVIFEIAFLEFSLLRKNLYFVMHFLDHYFCFNIFLAPSLMTS